MSPRGYRGRWPATGLLVLAIGAGVTTVARAGAQGGSEPAGDAWIDTPLEGTIVEPGPVTVLAHATDVGGVSGLRLLVDDGPVAEARDLSGTLAQATFTVEVVAEGEHRLVAVAVGESGEVRSAPVVIVVGAPPLESITTTTETTTTTTTIPVSTAPTTTVSRPPPTSVATTVAPTSPPPPPTTPPTPPPTPPPTSPPTTACTLVTPTAISPAGSETNNSTEITFVWRYDGPCDPAAFVVQVSRDRSFVAVDVSARVDGSARSVPLTVPCVTGTWQWRVGPSPSPSGDSPGPWSVPGVFNRTLCR